ncbi:MAG: molybdopterin-dependent oxidoreductase [Thermodesulfobacteriota bacterium]
MKINRRQFLRMAGLMGGASLFGGCHFLDPAGPVPRYIEGAPSVDPAETIPGVRSVYTVCGLCAGNCGIRCRVATGALVKIDGSPWHPASAHRLIPFDTPLEQAIARGGSVCAIGGSGIQTLYDPFRVARPLKRIGPRGSGKWKALTWKEAVNEILEGGDLFGEGNVQGLKSLKQAGSGPNFLVGDADWGSLTFIKRFVEAFPGADIQRDHAVLLKHAAARAADAVFGPGDGAVDASYRTARFVLNIGDAPLDSGVPLLSLARDIADARLAHPGFKWAVADPRLSTSASKADLWLPVIPGRDLELALGIMRALAQQYPEQTKFPDPGLKEAVMARSLDAYAAAAGISPETILECARNLAQEGPRAAVMPGRGILGQPNGLEIAKVVLAINKLVGSEPGTGGLVRGSRDFLHDAETRLLKDRKRSWEPRLFGDPVKALIVWQSDPVYDDPASASGYFKSREKVPLFVAVDHGITETSAWADYILPETTYLERWDICVSPPAVTMPGIGFRSPAVGSFDAASGNYAPILPETKPMEDAIYLLGAGLALPGFEPDASGRVGTAWDYYQQAFTAVLESMKNSGYPVASNKEYMQAALERGGVFVQRGEKAGVKTAKSSTASKPLSIKPLSEQTPVSADTLRLITYSLPFHRSPNSGINSWLLEVLPENRLMINPQDARRLGIKDLDRIVIESLDQKTRVQGKAQVTPGIRPGVVAIANGFGYTQSGAQVRTIDGTPSTADKTRAAGINPTGLKKVIVRRA